MLPLHECAVESVADPTAANSVAESVAKPLHSVANSTTAGAAPTKTSCFCI
jgi:hypothetical protein